MLIYIFVISLRLNYSVRFLRESTCFAHSMATEKLFMKSEYISSTTALEKEATKTSPIFSSASQFLTASDRAILKLEKINIFLWETEPSFVNL